MRLKRSRRVKKWMKLYPQFGLPKKVRPRHKRCPRCKKIRMWWMPANMWGSNRTGPGNVDGQRMCWVCMKRHPIVGVHSS